MPVAAGSVFRHEAMLYVGLSEFIRQTTPFIREAISAEQPILVAVDRGKIDELRRLLGAEAAKVHFEDMATIGRNPARIIPVGARSWINTPTTDEGRAGSGSRSGPAGVPTSWSNASGTKHC